MRPEILSVNISETCNNACTFCLTRYRQPGTAKMMDWDTYVKILEQAEELGCRFLQLHGLNEMFTNPRAIDMVEEATKRGFRLWMYTNATLLNKEIIKRLSRRSIWRLSVSVYGFDRESYIQNARTDNFDKMYNNILEIFEQFSTPESIEYTENTNIVLSFLNIPILVDNAHIIMEKFGNLVSNFNAKKGKIIGDKILDNVFRRSGRARIEWNILEDSVEPRLHQEPENKNYLFHGYGCKERSTGSKCEHSCARIAFDCMVYPNGDVCYCCSNMDHEGVLGNIHVTSLRRCWESDYAESLRRLFFNGQKHLVPLCSHCALGPPKSNFTSFYNMRNSIFKIDDEWYAHKYRTMDL